MRSTGFLGKLLPVALCAAAAFAIGSGCTSSTAGGSAGPGMEGGDGGMMSADGGMGGGMSGMADAGASMGQAAGNAANSATSGMQSAGESMADAGSSAYGAASSAASSAAGDMADAGSQMASADMDAGSSGGTGSSGGGGSASSGGGGASMSDPQIAAVAVAANKVDVDAGKLAKSKSKNAKVKKFANDMIRDHTSAIKQAVKLVTKLGVTPEENDTSRSLTQGGQENMTNLKKLKGKEFDKAYMEHEVAYHQQVLDALDKALIPSAQNAELKSLLESVRGVIAQHLEHANQVSQALSK
jgi:putative membrane protein